MVGLNSLWLTLKLIIRHCIIVLSCIKTKRNRLYYSSLSRHIFFELADLIVRGIINKQGSQIPVSTLSERTYCDNDTNKQRGLKQRKEAATPGHKLEPS